MTLKIPEEGAEIRDRTAEWENGGESNAGLSESGRATKPPSLSLTRLLELAC